jgi:hypothetical protein
MVLVPYQASGSSTLPLGPGRPSDRSGLKQSPNHEHEHKSQRYHHCSREGGSASSCFSCRFHIAHDG